jgi:hypothetical protein
MKDIVMPTINPITEAIKRLDAMEDSRLIVLGDKQTPTN